MLLFVGFEQLQFAKPLIYKGFSIQYFSKNGQTESFATTKLLIYFNIHIYINNKEHV